MNCKINLHRPSAFVKRPLALQKERPNGHEEHQNNRATDVHVPGRFVQVRRWALHLPCLRLLNLHLCHEGEVSYAAGGAAAGCAAGGALVDESDD